MSKPTLRDMNAPDSSAEPEVTSIKKPADKLSLDKFKSKKEPLAQACRNPLSCFRNCTGCDRKGACAAPATSM